MLRTFKIVSFAAALVAMFTAGPTGAREPFAGIAGFRGPHRVLIVSDPASGGAALARQKALFEAESHGLAERRLVRVLAEKDALTVVMPNADPERGDGFDVWADPAGAAAVRTDQGLTADGFTVVLIGLDGGVKKRWDEPVSAEELFAVIDAMPMRQEELRRRELEGDDLRQEFEGR